MHHFIYAIYHEQQPDMFYVGRTVKSIEIRFQQHRKKLQENKHFNARLQNIVNKYGINGLKYKILEQCNPISIVSLSLLEDCYIELYQKQQRALNFFTNKNWCKNDLYKINDVSTRMRLNNPMKNKEVRDKVSQTVKQKYPASRIYQYDKEGNLIKIWTSTSEAASALNIDESNLSRACNLPRLSANSFWLYESNKNKIQEKILQYKNKIRKSNNIVVNSQNQIYQIDLKTLQIINIFKSVILASKALQTDRNSIYHALSGKYALCKGYILIYQKDYPTDLQKKIDQVNNLNNSANEKIHQIDVESGTIINTFRSTKEAGLALQKDPSCISRAATGCAKSAYGYLWIYDKDFSNDKVLTKIENFHTRQRKTN